MRSCARSMTLAELLVVIALLAVMSGIVISGIESLINPDALLHTQGRLKSLRASILGPAAIGDTERTGGFIQDMGWPPVRAGDLMANPYDRLRKEFLFPRRQYDRTWHTWYGWGGPYYFGDGVIYEKSVPAHICDGWGAYLRGWLAGQPWPLKWFDKDGNKELDNGELLFWTQLADDLAVDRIDRLQLMYDAYQYLESPDSGEGYALAVYSVGSDLKGAAAGAEGAGAVYDYSAELPADPAVTPLVRPCEWRIEMKDMLTLDLGALDADMLSSGAWSVESAGSPYRFAFILPRAHSEDGVIRLTLRPPHDLNGWEPVSAALSKSEMVSAAGEGSMAFISAHDNCRVPCGRRTVMLVADVGIRWEPLVITYDTRKYIVCGYLMVSNIVTAAVPEGRPYRAELKLIEYDEQGAAGEGE